MQLADKQSSQLCLSMVEDGDHLAVLVHCNSAPVWHAADNFQLIHRNTHLCLDAGPSASELRGRSCEAQPADVQTWHFSMKESP